MNCPKCKSELIKDGQARLQSLDEHVSNPNALPSLKTRYVCSNKECVCNTQEDESVCWNSDGECYGGFKIFEHGQNTGPYGSYERKAQVEIYKHGPDGPLKKKVYLSPIWMLWFYQPFIEYHYKSNENGDILKRSWSIEILKKDKGLGNRYCVHASFCWQTWRFLWRNFKRKMEDKNYAKAFSTGYNDRWVYRWFHTFITIVYYSRWKSVEHEAQVIWRDKDSFKYMGI